MASGCPRCGAAPVVGALCRDCADALPRCEGLLREHVRSRVIEPAGWLVDRFGAAHALAARTSIGRRPDGDLVVLHRSVSRDHAELRRDERGWELRDLGSRNATRVDGKRVSRGPVRDRAIVVIGEVAFHFRSWPIELPGVATPSLATAAPARLGTFAVRQGAVELRVVATERGVTLLRRDGARWAEVSAPRLELELLRALCAHAAAQAGSPARTTTCLSTRHLAALIPFQTVAASEENVRQLVRRLRTTLDDAGLAGLVETVPGRGYYVAWQVEAP